MLRMEPSFSWARMRPPSSVLRTSRQFTRVPVVAATVVSFRVGRAGGWSTNAAVAVAFVICPAFCADSGDAKHKAARTPNSRYVVLLRIGCLTIPSGPLTQGPPGVFLDQPAYSRSVTQSPDSREDNPTHVPIPYHFCQGNQGLDKISTKGPGIKGVTGKYHKN